MLVESSVCNTTQEACLGVLYLLNLAYKLASTSYSWPAPFQKCA